LALSTVEAFALYPSASVVGSDSDNIGAESDQATEDTPTVAIRMALFSINARRETLMDFSFSWLSIQSSLHTAYSWRHSRSFGIAPRISNQQRGAFIKLAARFVDATS
jgi:hypothetical protein